jgi:hypothetical protein
MQTRARIVIALGSAAVLSLLGVVMWLDSQDWKKLLLFGGIVGVAAWGWGREAPAAVKHPVDEPIADDAHVPEETAG